MITHLVPPIPRWHIRRSAARLALVLAATISEAASGETPLPKRFAIINGGASVSGHFDWAEKDVMAFYERLFERRAVVLSASGPGSRVALTADDGELKRDPQTGLVELSPSTLTMPTEAATLANVRRLFERWRKDEPHAVTLVFGDHGAPDGVSLWGETLLTPAEIRRLHRRLPPWTTVRSLHLHCHGGAALVDPQRKVPTMATQWPKYLDEYYRPNSCGLSIAADDELAYATYGDKPWDQGKAAAMLDEIRAEGRFGSPRKVSLRQMQEWLENRNDMPTTPMLTSDYLVADIHDYLCSKGWPGRGTSPARADHAGAQPGRAADTTSPCAETPRRRQLAQLEKRIEEQTALLGEAFAIGNLVAHDVLDRAASFPDLNIVPRRLGLAQVRGWQNEIDTLREKLIADDGKLSPDDRRLLESNLDMLLGMTTSYDQAHLSVAFGYALRSDFDSIFRSDTFWKKVRQSHARTFPKLLELMQKPAEARALREDPHRWIGDLLTSLQSLQKQRRELAIKERKAMRRDVESALQRLGFGRLRERYEAIRLCEIQGMD